MSTASIIAFLAFLLAFNVPAPVIQNVSTILYASQASTTAIQATTTLQATPTGGASVTVQNTTPQPTFGGIIQAMDQSQITIGVEKEIWSGYDNGVYTLTIRVLDSNGDTVKNAPIHMESDSLKVGLYKTDSSTNALTSKESNDWWQVMYYFPPSPGSHTVTVTSGSLSKEITVGN